MAGVGLVVLLMTYGMQRQIYKVNLARDVAELERQRDKLFIALKRLVDCHADDFHFNQLIAARKVIDEIENGSTEKILNLVVNHRRKT